MRRVSRTENEYRFEFTRGTADLVEVMRDSERDESLGDRRLAEARRRIRLWHIAPAFEVLELEEEPPPARTGRPPRTQAFMAGVASLYRRDKEMIEHIRQNALRQGFVLDPGEIPATRSLMAQRLGVSEKTISNILTEARQQGFLPDLDGVRLRQVARAFVSAHPGWKDDGQYSEFVAAPREESVRAVRDLSFVTKRHEAESLIDAACDAGLLPPSARTQRSAT